VVGDRLDTDIEGANAVGCPSLLVLSGVTTAADLVEARSELRPTYLGRDVSALLDTHPEPVIHPDGASCRNWRVIGRRGRWELSRLDGADDDMLDALRALCAAEWDADRSGPGPERADRSRDPVSADTSGDQVTVVAKHGDAAAARAVQELGLAP
jgi:hypothetical protein